MKRSVAIKLLFSKLTKMGVCTYSDDIDNIYEYEVNEILQFIESEIGMLPPKTYVDDPNYFYPVSRNKWEPEDEI